MELQLTDAHIGKYQLESGGVVKFDGATLPLPDGSSFHVAK